MGANNEMNGQMRKNCLKAGRAVRYHWTVLNLLLSSQFSISGYKWLQIWRFQSTNLQQNTLFYSNSEERGRKKWLFVKERQGVYVALLPSSRKAGGSHRGSQPGSTLEGPHKSWFEQGANQRRRGTSRKGRGAVSLLKCYVWLSLPIRWQLNFNINMIILK